MSLDNSKLAEQSTAKKQSSNLTNNSNQTDDINVSSTSKSGKKRLRKSKKSKRIKDPSVAALYLNNWKLYKLDSTVTWKFNKNTQSWLLRHMYEPTKVAKDVFSLLIEYIVAAKSESIINRIVHDATKRALRYKQYEMNKSGGIDDKQLVTVPPASPMKEDVEPLSATKRQIQEEQEDVIADTIRWNSLDEHDKRKEYKRARKVLDTLQQKTQN